MKLDQLTMRCCRWVAELGNDKYLEIGECLAYNNPLKYYFPMLKFRYATIDQTFGNGERILDLSYRS